MDIFKDKGSHTQGGTKHINKPTTHQERTQENCALFCVYTAREKENTNTNQERQQRKTTRAKQNKEKKDRTKSRSKEIKRKAKGDRQKDKKRGKHASSL